MVATFAAVPVELRRLNRGDSPDEQDASTR